MDILQFIRLTAWQLVLCASEMDLAELACRICMGQEAGLF